jgi:hypothetical protein
MAVANCRLTVDQRSSGLHTRFQQLQKVCCVTDKSFDAMNMHAYVIECGATPGVDFDLRASRDRQRAMVANDHEGVINGSRDHAPLRASVGSRSRARARHGSRRVRDYVVRSRASQDHAAMEHGSGRGHDRGAVTIRARICAQIRPSIRRGMRRWRRDGAAFDSKISAQLGVDHAKTG